MMAKKIAGCRTDGGDEESGAMLLVARHISFYELLHAEQEVSGVDPSPVEGEEMLC